MSLGKRNFKKIMWLIAYTLVLLVGIWKLDSVILTISWILSILKPFIVGICIAFLLCQPINFIENRIFRRKNQKGHVLGKAMRPLSILLSLFFVLGLVFLAIFIIAPEVGKTIKTLVITIPGFVTKAQAWVTNLLHEYPQINDFVSTFTLDWSKLSETLLGASSFLASGAFNSIASIVGGLVNTVTTFIIGFVFAIYILANKEQLSCQAKKICYSYLPRKRVDRLIMIMQLTNKTFGKYITGQCLEALILGAMFFVTLTLLRFPYALLIGVLVAFTALIPILGAYIGSAISTFLIFMVNPIQAAWFIVVFNVLQQIEGNFIYPYVVGGSVGLPSIWVLFAVTVGGSLMGIAGMIIFIPIFSVIYVLLREDVHVRLIVKRVPAVKYENVE